MLLLLIICVQYFKSKEHIMVADIQGWQLTFLVLVIIVSILLFAGLLLIIRGMNLGKSGRRFRSGMNNETTQKTEMDSQ